MISLGGFTSGYISTNTVENLISRSFLSCVLVCPKFVPDLRAFCILQKRKPKPKSIPMLRSFLLSIKEKMNKKVIPFIKRFPYSAVYKVLNEAIIPSVSSCLYFVAEIVQKSVRNVAIFVGMFCVEHPWLLFWSPFPTKMMKAPERNYKISRANFERNPGSYFREHRKKKNKSVKIMVVMVAAVVVGLTALS
ncbi:hypothetical protein MKX01_017214 [Papaver californicum]|nr:hypothetical protein MKX01_017214 [Papaver californicum]